MPKNRIASYGRAMIAAGMVGTAASQGQAAASPVPTFNQFVADLAAPRAKDYVADAKSAEAALFDEAAQYLRNYYAGLSVRQTVTDADGRTMDCIRYDQQPALRLQGLRSIASPPPFPADAEAEPGPVATVKSACAAGTFPIERMTLEQVMHAGGLRNFFRKSPDSYEHAPGTSTIIPPNSGGHAYAYAYQSVNSTGGRTTESLYSPAIDGGKGEIFSLEQQWYIGGSGAATQTAEVGWQAYPGLYGTPKSVLFAYYTADDYQQTGCYNYSCGKFVQNSSSPIMLAQPFKKYSVSGGKQVKIKIGYTFYNGGWWLAYGNAWVGYYPTSVYNGGQLSKYATLIEDGTETVGSSVWPPAGSGQFASTGYPNAAYQAKISYLDQAGTTHTPSLTPQQPSPSCYTASTPGALGNKLGYGYFLGGPGGTGC